MKRAIWFDMDGTIYELYEIPDWLECLQEKRYSVYNQAGKARVNLDRIREAVRALTAQGWEVGIITWAGKNVKRGSWEFEAIAHFKREWTAHNFPELLDNFQLLEYGESKADYAPASYDLNILVDDNTEVREAWRKYTSEGSQFKTINASRSYARMLEELID